MERPDFALEAREPVMITPFEREDVWAGQFVGSSHDDVKVQLNEDLEVGSLLKLERGDVWMLAEVVRCQQSTDGFCADLALLNWINKSELKRLVWGSEEPMLQATPEAAGA